MLYRLKSEMLELLYHQMLICLAEKEFSPPEILPANRGPAGDDGFSRRHRMASDFLKMPLDSLPPLPYDDGLWHLHRKTTSIPSC